MAIRVGAARKFLRISGRRIKPIFFIPLADAGSGAVNISPSAFRGSPAPIFTRTSVAWTKLSSGLWAAVGSGTPRSCYLGQDTAVGAYGGFYSEGPGTQLVTPSASIRDMTDASWVATTVTATKTATGIDGVTNSASTITATGAAGTILQTLVAAASSRTYSCWIKRRTGTGTILLLQGATTLDVTALINSSTYTRVSLNASVLNVAFGIQIATNGDALDVDFNQFESGTIPSSPMQTSGSSVRQADVLTYPSAGNVLDSVGTSYAEVQLPYSFTNDSPGISVSGSNREVLGVVATTMKVEAFDGANNPTTSSSFSTGVVAKAVSSWSASGNSLSVYLNGLGKTTTPYGGAMFAGSPISIGMNSLGNFYGTIKNVRIWNSVFSDGKIASL